MGRDLVLTPWARQDLIEIDSWLEEAGIREEVTAAAIKAVIAAQIADEMKKRHINKAQMAKLMETSRAQVDRLLVSVPVS